MRPESLPTTIKSATSTQTVKQFKTKQQNLLKNFYYFFATDCNKFTFIKNADISGLNFCKNKISK